MDDQFASDLKMRKEALDIGKKSTFLYGNLKVLQKVSLFLNNTVYFVFQDYKSFGTYVNDMTYQARANTKAIEGLGYHILCQTSVKQIPNPKQAILEREDMRTMRD